MAAIDALLTRPKIDLVLALIGGLVAWKWLPVPDSGSAQAIFGALAGLAGLVCGLGGLGLGIQRGTKRAESLERAKPGLVRTVWVSTLVGAFLGAVAPVVALYLNGPQPRVALARCFHGALV